MGWEQITYTYDPSGRRIAKDVDGVVTKYGAACPELVERDGDQCIAEYDANDVLLRKYIYGPGIDQPICMIEAAGGYAGTYFYHYDALGSVVALSDAAGDTVQVYEYDVYGQVAASDPNHPNRFLFTGREFDAETGLYYYRARYYNASIGRFLQTDPMGYEAGMNLYAYCDNNPTGLFDPYGCDPEDSGENWRTIWGHRFRDSDGNIYQDTRTFTTAAEFWSYLCYAYWPGGCMMPFDFLISNIFGADALDSWGDSRTVTFERVYYYGVGVTRINGINLLNDSLLDSILEADDARNVLSFHELNESTSPSVVRGLDFMEWWYTWKTAFANTNDEAVQHTWLFYGGTEFVPIYEISPQFPGIPAVVGYEEQYIGGKYIDSQINYIIQGHAAAKAGVPLSLGIASCYVHGAQAGVLTPAEKLFWFRKGYNEYHKRSHW